ncbi:adenylosuccinate lyase, partial [Candidatus Bipolaricaulota bacterium]|nr:adenylosuccinate lyase [Candidatus Bipolaricaulota bacterium]
MHEHENEHGRDHDRDPGHGREISPLDGRYRSKTEPLRESFGEFALMGARCDIELRYLLALDELDVFPKLSNGERKRIKTHIGGLTDEQFARIKQIEARVHHDVKACELFLREGLELAEPNRIHFGLTSEDVNNLAYATLLRQYRDEVQLPTLGQLIDRLAEKVDRWKAVVFPAHTHGQAASPTTVGK